MVYLTVFIALLAAAGIVLMVRGAMEVQSDDSHSPSARVRRLSERSHRLSRAGDADSEIYEEMARLEEQRATAQRPSVLPAVTKFVSANSVLGRLEEDLLQVKSPWRASELLAASLALSLLVFMLLAYLGLGIFSLLLALPFLFLPWGYVKFERAVYYRRFDAQLADALLLMSNSLSAGFSFLQAMETVAREAQQPIADEFNRVTQEISIGIPTTQALENLRDRIKSMDLNLVVTAVLIQREVGGGLAGILITISDVIRERLRIRGEIRVLTTQGRGTGAILSLLPLFMMALLHFVSAATAEPGEGSYVSILWRDPRGIWMLAIAFGMQLIGFFVIMRVVSIRV